MPTVDLSDRRKLFSEVLPEWEGIIASLAYNLLRTRTIDRGLLGVEDIQQELRLVLLQAVEKFEEGTPGRDGKEAQLDTWITKLLRQKCSLIVQEHYNKVPRDAEGTARHPIPLITQVGEDGELVFDIEDPTAEEAFAMIAAEDWFRYNVSLIYSVLEVRDSIDERRTFAMILSSKYSSDREIAEELGLNFAKVGEVRFKAKLIFALLEHIPIESFTRAQNAESLTKRLRRLIKLQENQPPITEPSGPLTPTL